jgi:hypothetical protein
MKKGRPPKFREPRRPITVTLPENTLARLAAIDPDRARAIVKATEAATARDAKTHRRVELVEVMPGLGIIVVGPSRYLQKIEWLRLVEVAPMRFLLILPSGTPVDSLEVAIIDLLEDLGPHDEWEKSVLQQLRDLIRDLRLRGKLSRAELLLIDTGTIKGSGLVRPFPKRRSNK